MPYNPSNYTRCEKCKHIDRENEKCKITNDNWLVPDRAGTCHQFEGVESMDKNLWIRVKKEYAEHLGLDHRGEYRVLDETEHEFKIFDGKYLWVKKVWTDFSNKYEISNSLQLAKNFDEQMEKVRDLASKCGTSGEGLFINELEDKHSFRCVIDEMFDLYNIKNKNYGNSFSKSYEEYGLTMVCIRLEDKLRRLKSLNKQGENANTDDESIRDTLIDLANYSVMAIMELDK